jgi:hypothetical protein
MRFLLISAMVLSIGCLLLAVFHWVHLRRDLKKGSKDIVTQRPVWLEFPRAYTKQGQHHQRRFFVYIIVFVALLILLFVAYGADFSSV